MKMDIQELDLLADEGQEVFRHTKNFNHTRHKNLYMTTHHSSDSSTRLRITSAHEGSCKKQRMRRFLMFP